MDYCFKKLNIKSTIRKNLLEICDDENNWVDPKIGTFFQITPPNSLIFSDPFLKYICDKHLDNNGYDINVKIFLIKPWTHYMLHTDRFRSASINLLLNNFTDSISYFQTSEPYNKLHINITELAYEEDSYYLFNSKVPHAITNREPARYLLSITLKDDYITTLKSLKSQNFL